MTIRTNAISRGSGGFTLPEILVSMAILLIIVGIALSCQMYGLRMFEFVKPKLGASDDARRTVGRLVEQIRSANIIRVGNGTFTNFTEIAPNFPQQGNAIQVYPTTNMSQYVRYYRDPADQKLKVMTNGASAPVVLAHSVSNQVVFSSEDFSGHTLTNNQNNRVIGVALSFFQIHYPTTPIGPGNFYDRYDLRTKITRRLL